MNLNIKGKIILTISIIIIVTLAAVMIMVSKQSSRWFDDEAKERLNTAANIIFADLDNRFRFQVRSIEAISKDESVLSTITLIRDFIAEHPQEPMDEAHVQMANYLAMKLRDASDMEGFDLLRFYDSNGNLVAFYRKKGNRMGWVSGKGKFLGPTYGEDTGDVEVPPGIEIEYASPISIAAFREYEPFDDAISLHTYNPVYETVEEMNSLAGFIGVNTLLDDEYAKEVSHLSNTKINVFVGQNYSAGIIDKSQMETIKDTHYSELLNRYKSAKNKRNIKELMVDLDTRIGEENFYQKVYPFSSDNKVIGAISMLHSKKAAETKKGRALIIMAIIAVVSSIIGIIVSVAFSAAITNPLKKSVDIANKLSDGDLAIDIEITGKDETGQLLKAMQNMVVTLREIVQMVSDTTTRVNSSALEISSAIEQQAGIATEQSASVSEISSTMEELSASSTQIANNSESVAGIATRALENTERGATSVEAVMVQMNEINEDKKKSIKEIVDLGGKTKEITKVMEIINNIADQTKLLAFNAALEASSAGEAGKRFGVVATEIRRLADSVTESTGEIEDRIIEIQEAVNNLVVTSERGSQKIQEGLEVSSETVVMLEEILSGSRTTADAAKQISLSTQQQKTATDQCVVSLREIKQGAEQTAATVKQTQSITESLKTLSAELLVLVEQFKLVNNQD